MIRHTVAFKLIHPKNSPEEKAFLGAIVKLSAIPGVTNLELLKQTSRKNKFDYGLSMEFATRRNMRITTGIRTMSGLLRLTGRQK